MILIAMHCVFLIGLVLETEVDLFQLFFLDKNWLVVEPTHLKNVRKSKFGSFPQVRVKITNV